MDNCGKPYFTQSTQVSSLYFFRQVNQILRKGLESNTRSFTTQSTQEDQADCAPLLRASQMSASLAAALDFLGSLMILGKLMHSSLRVNSVTKASSSLSGGICRQNNRNLPLRLDIFSLPYKNLMILNLSPSMRTQSSLSGKRRSLFEFSLSNFLLQMLTSALVNFQRVLKLLYSVGNLMAPLLRSVGTKQSSPSSQAGMGRETRRQGSKHTDTFLQVEQITVDLNCPTIRFRMYDWMRFAQFSSLYLLISSSGLISSPFSKASFFFTRFRSQESPSIRQLMNSCESCWPKPENCVATLPMIFLSLKGETDSLCPVHIYLMSSAQVHARLPLVPRGLLQLMWFLNSSLMKNSVISLVLLRHCSPLFMQQVLPRFFRPTTPFIPPKSFSCRLKFLKITDCCFRCAYYSSHFFLWFLWSALRQSMPQYLMDLHLQKMSFSVCLQSLLPHFSCFLPLRALTLSCGMQRYRFPTVSTSSSISASLTMMLFLFSSNSQMSPAPQLTASLPFSPPHDSFLVICTVRKDNGLSFSLLAISIFLRQTSVMISQGLSMKEMLKRLTSTPPQRCFRNSQHFLGRSSQAGPLKMQRLVYSLLGVGSMKMRQRWSMSSNWVMGPGCFFYFWIFSILVQSFHAQNHLLLIRNLGIPSIIMELSSYSPSNFQNQRRSSSPALERLSCPPRGCPTMPSSTSLMTEAWYLLKTGLSLRSLLTLPLKSCSNLIDS